GPHQITARIVEMRAGMRGLVVAAKAIDRDAIDVLQGDEQAIAAHARHQREAVQEFRIDAPPRLLVEENLASNSEDTSVDSLCLRQKLPAHPRGATVGRDQNVAVRRRAVLEMRHNAADRAFLVAHKCLAEMHYAFKARQQYLPQRDAAD